MAASPQGRVPLSAVESVNTIALRLPEWLASPTRQPRFGRAERHDHLELPAAAACARVIANTTDCQSARHALRRVLPRWDEGQPPREATGAPPGDPLPTPVLVTRVASNTHASRRAPERRIAMMHRSERTFPSVIDPNPGPAQPAQPDTASSTGARQVTNRDESGGELVARLERTLVGQRVLYPELSHAIVGAAIEVHRHLGPGKLESTYQRALDEELSLRGIAHRGQVPIALHYKGRDVGSYVLDFIVEDKIVLELKAVERQHAVYKAQLLSYLHATRLRLGMLINFNVPLLWTGVQRVVL